MRTRGFVVLSDQPGYSRYRAKFSFLLRWAELLGVQSSSVATGLGLPAWLQYIIHPPTSGFFEASSKIALFYISHRSSRHRRSAAQFSSNNYKNADASPCTRGWACPGPTKPPEHPDNGSARLACTTTSSLPELSAAIEAGRRRARSLWRASHMHNKILHRFDDVQHSAVRSRRRAPERGECSRCPRASHCCPNHP